MPGEASFAVVGATGLVGREALAILAERGVPAGRVRALASERSLGQSVPYAGGALGLGRADRSAFAGVDIALFCATSALAAELSAHAISAGAAVIDNSSAYRMDPAVPLVVPEINGGLLESRPRLVANPNCSTIILLSSLTPLRRRFGVVSIGVATYQAVSGAGQAGLDELHAQTIACGTGRPVAASFFTEPCAFNVFSHDSAVELDTGVNGEERKIIEESRRIWDDPFLRLTPTCVRVPVPRAHSQAITVELETPATESDIREAIASGDGLRLVDDRASNSFPTPAKATGRDEILIGRIRPDPGTPGGPKRRTRRWCLFVSADQLRKGAALNAVQIAERLLGCAANPAPGPEVFSATSR